MSTVYVELQKIATSASNPVFVPPTVLPVLHQGHQNSEKASHLAHPGVQKCRWKMFSYVFLCIFFNTWCHVGT